MGIGGEGENLADLIGWYYSFPQGLPERCVPRVLITRLWRLRWYIPMFPWALPKANDLAPLVLTYICTNGVTGTGIASLGGDFPKSAGASGVRCEWFCTVGADIQKHQRCDKH